MASLELAPKRLPWDYIRDSLIELGAIVSAVVFVMLVCWGMWATSF
jgi:hypothetical protein